jgi:hypothetical protein
VHLSDQAAIPYLVTAAEYASGFTTLTLPAGFDLVLLEADGFIGSGASNPGVVVETAASKILFGFPLNNVISGTGAAGQWRGFTVVPYGTGLKVYAADDNTFVSISGYLLTPQTVSFLPV